MQAESCPGLVSAEASLGRMREAASVSRELADALRSQNADLGRLERLLNTAVEHAVSIVANQSQQGGDVLVFARDRCQLECDGHIITARSRPAAPHTAGRLLALGGG